MNLRIAPRLLRAASLVVALSATMASATPPATAPAAPTSAPSASPAATSCGDHLLEAGEKCETCAADCRAEACTPKGRFTATVSLTPQGGYETVGAATVLLGYRTNRLALPASGSQPEVQARLTGRQPGAQLFVNDLDYGVRVVATRGDGIQPGAVFSLAFDGCAGAPAPTGADLACRVEACAAGGVPLPECTCSVKLESGGPS